MIIFIIIILIKINIRMSDIQRKSARKRSIPRKSTNESIDPESENEILEKKKYQRKSLY